MEKTLYLRRRKTTKYKKHEDMDVKGIYTAAANRYEDADAL